MAKKKVHPKKTHHYRSRRMGAVSAGKDDVMEALGLVAAALAGTAIQRTMVSIPVKIISAAEAVGGWIMKKSAHPFLRGAGWGLFGTGVIGLTHEFGILKGVEDYVSGLMGDVGEVYISDGGRQSGISNNDMMSGISNNSTVSGETYQYDVIRGMS